MILDTAKVSLSDGSFKQAIEVYPGGELMSYMKSSDRSVGKVLNRKVDTKTDIIGIVLNNGQRLCGCRNQRVAVFRKQNVCYTRLADVEIGDHVRGQLQGMPIVLGVVGLVFYPRKEARLVEFEIEHGKPFVAEGVMCK